MVQLRKADVAARIPPHVFFLVSAISWRWRGCHARRLRFCSLCCQIGYCDRHRCAAADPDAGGGGRYCAGRRWGGAAPGV